MDNTDISGIPNPLRFRLECHDSFHFLRLEYFRVSIETAYLLLFSSVHGRFLISTTEGRRLYWNRTPAALNDFNVRVKHIKLKSHNS